MAKLFKVSQSKLKLWKRCRRAYRHKYLDKLRPKRKSRPLVFGTIVHDMIEADANGDDPFEVLDNVEMMQGPMFAEEVEYYGDLLEDVEDIMSDYFNYHKYNPLTYIRLNKRNAEHIFEVEVPKRGLMITGKIDALARTKNKLRWLVEHKSFGKMMPTEDHRWRDLQTSVYMKITQFLGFPQVDGVCWDYIRSKAPSWPKLLKNGKLQRKAIDSLPTRVEKGLDILKYDPNTPEAQHIIRLAETNQGRYFQRIFTPTKMLVANMLFDQFLSTAEEVSELHGKSDDMTIDRHCEWCDYEPICRALLTGSDVDYVIERQYYEAEDNENEQDPASIARASIDA